MSSVSIVYHRAVNVHLFAVTFYVSLNTGSGGNDDDDEITVHKIYAELVTTEVLFHGENLL
jgi:hypothetical protein